MRFIQLDKFKAQTEAEVAKGNDVSRMIYQLLMDEPVFVLNGDTDIAFAIVSGSDAEKVLRKKFIDQPSLSIRRYSMSEHGPRSDESPRLSKGA